MFKNSITKSFSGCRNLRAGPGLRLFSGNGRVNQDSKFEDYNDTSNHYDKTRVPVGVSTILNQLPNEANQSMVLDAGAGTGNYTFELAKHVKNIVAFEVNDGMVG